MDSVMDKAAWIVAHPIESAIVAAAGALGLVVAYLLLRLVWRVTSQTLTWLFARYVTGRSVEDVLTIVAASIATGVSAQGMWRFAEDVLHLPIVLRVLLFGFIEVAVVTSAVRARRNMRDNFSAGVDGIAVWALTCLTAILSSLHPSSFPEKVFRLAAPLVAAWLWERGMAIERRRIRGTGRINWRITPERAFVWLGIAEASDRTAGEVDGQRRRTRLALAAKRARELRDSGASDRKVRAALRKLDVTFEQAAEHLGLGRDPEMQEQVRREVAALYSASTLMDVPADSAWVRPVEEPFTRLADETQRLNGILAAQHDAKSSIANLAMLAADATGHRLVPSTYSSTHNGVDGGVDKQVDKRVDGTPGQALVPSPRRLPSSTALSTAFVAVERVDEPVDFDLTDPTVFDLERMWSSTPSSPLSSTSPSTPDEVDEPVDEDGDEASKTKVMRDFWDSEVAQKRYPRPVDLANHAKASRSLAGRLREKWVEELNGWAKRNAKKALRDKASA